MLQRIPSRKYTEHTQWEKIIAIIYLRDFHVEYIKIYYNSSVERQKVQLKLGKVFEETVVQRSYTIKHNIQCIKAKYISSWKDAQYHFLLEKCKFRDSLAIQWLGISTFAIRDLGSIPGQRIKIPQVLWCGQKIK